MERGWIIFHGFAYNGATLATRSLFPDEDPCVPPPCDAHGRRMCREMEFSNGGKQLLTFFLLFCASDSFDFWRDVWFKILCGYE